MAHFWQHGKVPNGTGLSEENLKGALATAYTWPSLRPREALRYAKILEL